MTTWQHIRAIAVLGLPLIGGHLAQFAIGLTDTVMLGWYSVEALAAVVLGSTTFFVIFIMGSGFGFAVMPMVAEADARGDATATRRITRMGIWLSLLVGIAVQPIFFFTDPILRALGQDPLLSLEAEAYLRIAGLGMIPAYLVMVLKSYLAALGRTQVVFWVTAGSALVNAGANYVLIFGKFGAPEMGITGAAIASLATHGVALVGVVVYAAMALPEHDLFRRIWRPDWEVFAQVFRLGLPIGITNLMEVGLFSAASVMLGWLGTIQLAAHGIALQLASAAFMIQLGLSNAATIRVGNAWGRKDYDHMARGGFVVTAMSIIAAVATAAIFVAVPEPLIGSFIAPDEPERLAILAAGAGLLAVAGLFQLVDGAQALALGLLRGVQDTRLPMILAGIGYWVIGVPSSYVMGFVLGWGGIGVWLGLCVGLACVAAMLSWRFWRTILPEMRAQNAMPIG